MARIITRFWQQPKYVIISTPAQIIVPILEMRDTSSVDGRVIANDVLFSIVTFQFYIRIANLMVFAVRRMTHPKNTQKVKESSIDMVYNELSSNLDTDTASH